MELKLTGKLKQQKRWVIATCPELDVASQGDDEQDAKRMLSEAVRIFLEETTRMGTLDKILTEAKLPCVPSGERLKVKLDFGQGAEVAFTTVL